MVITIMRPRLMDGLLPILILYQELQLLQEIILRVQMELFLNSFVTSSTQSQTQDPEFVYGSISNDPYNGMDFQYVFNNYF